MMPKTATILPADFTPTAYHVIIGRGRAVKNHSGNKRFDALIADSAKAYSAAPCKAEKGIILTRIINQVHDINAGAGFVRKDPASGNWSLVEESLARQTAAQAMRNFLHNDYRSSKQFKSKRRTQLIKEMNAKNSSSSETTSLLLSMSLARCVSPSESADEPTDTLSLFLSTFAENVETSENPFEPRPLAPSVDIFSPLPFSV